LKIFILAITYRIVSYSVGNGGSSLEGKRSEDEANHSSAYSFLVKNV